MSKKTLNLSILPQIFEIKSTKSQRTQIHIAEAAIRVICENGIENVTFEKIAKAAEVTRPLVRHYFPQTEDLLKFVWKYIQANLLQLSNQFVANQSDSKKMLKDYIEGTFRWLKSNPSHAKVWLLFYYYCSIRSEYLKINSDLALIGQKRIATILEMGKKEELFRFKNAMESAKLIQSLLTGALLVYLTEETGSKHSLRDQVYLGSLELISKTR